MRTGWCIHSSSDCCPSIASRLGRRPKRIKQQQHQHHQDNHKSHVSAQPHPPRSVATQPLPDNIVDIVSPLLPHLSADQLRLLTLAELQRLLETLYDSHHLADVLPASFLKATRESPGDLAAAVHPRQQVSSAVAAASEGESQSASSSTDVVERMAWVQAGMASDTTSLSSDRPPSLCSSSGEDKMSSSSSSSSVRQSPQPSFTTGDVSPAASLFRPSGQGGNTPREVIFHPAYSRLSPTRGLSLASPAEIIRGARTPCDTEREKLIRQVIDSASEANEEFNIHTSSKVKAIIDAYEMEMKAKVDAGMAMVRNNSCTLLHSLTIYMICRLQL